MIKVLLADDHQMFIDGMKTNIQQDENITVVGEANNGQEVLDFLAANEVDVVVLDINMPVLDGIEATKEIKNTYPKVKVLILTMFKERDFIMKLLDIGAAGYVLKDKTSEELLMAINNVHNDIPHYGLEIMSIAAMAQKEKKEEVDLTNREKEVLCLIAEGFTTKEISTKLFIAEPTVNTHRRNLLQKLDVPNSQHLVRYAIRHGMINA